MYRRVVRACIAGIALSAALAHAQKVPPQEAAAQSHVYSALVTGADAGVMGDKVTLGAELQRQLALPLEADGPSVYQGLLGLIGGSTVQVHRSTVQEIGAYSAKRPFASAGQPVFTVAVGDKQFLVRYNLQAVAISFVGQIGVEDPPPPPKAAAAAPPAPQPVVVKLGPLVWTVQFDWRSAKLEKPALAALDGDVAPRLPGAAQHKFRVSAYTDSMGTAPMNSQLAQKRAEAVRDYLAAKGVSPERIDLSVVGPVVEASTCLAEKTRRLQRGCSAPNRRVRIEALPPT